MFCLDVFFLICSISVFIFQTATIEGTFKGIDLMSKKKGSEGGVVINIASAAGIEYFNFINF